MRFVPWYSRSRFALCSGLLTAAVLLTGGVSGCGRGSAESKPDADSTSTPAKKTAPKNDSTPSTDEGGSGLVRVDSEGRKWIRDRYGDIPFDVFFPNPLAVAADQTTVKVAETGSNEPSGAPATDQETPKPAGQGVDWKQIVPAEVLDAEVKKIRGRLTKNTLTVSRFAQAAEEVQIDGVVLATLAMIAEQHPEPVRWKDAAPVIRELGLKLTESASEAGREAFQATQRTVEQLVAVLDGNNPPDLPEPQPAESFADIIDRVALMNRMDRTYQWMKFNVSGPDQLKESADEVRHEGMLVAALSQVMGTPGYDYAEEAGYQKHIASMVKAGLDMAGGAASQKFEKYQTGLSEMYNTCNRCHTDYRD